MNLSDPNLYLQHVQHTSGGAAQVTVMWQAAESCQRDGPAEGANWQLTGHTHMALAGAYAGSANFPFSFFFR